MANVILVDHPIAQHSLTILRCRETGTAEFRQHATLISQVLAIEATRHVSTSPYTVQTPLAPHEGKKLDPHNVFVPVLRAGLAMLFAVQQFLPDVPVGFIGLERDEHTALARSYYQKFPPVSTGQNVMILDPMLATGGSLSDTAKALQKQGATRMTAVCVIAAQEGIARIQREFPEMEIITAGIDADLNERKFIVPGLGDFGDRYFGT